MSGECEGKKQGNQRVMLLIIDLREAAAAGGYNYFFESCCSVCLSSICWKLLLLLVIDLLEAASTAYHRLVGRSAVAAGAVAGAVAAPMVTGTAAPAVFLRCGVSFPGGLNQPINSL